METMKNNTMKDVDVSLGRADNTSMVECVLDRTRLEERDISLCVTLPEDVDNRPAVFEEMQDDIDRLIRTVCEPYIDPGCVSLTMEELHSECRRKLAILLHRDIHIKLSTRKKFFGYLKTVFNNHVKGLVQRHRFTIKRTGIKPPDKKDKDGNRLYFQEHSKPIEISLDDPDAHLQVGDEPFADIGDGELIDDFISVLLPLEKVVFDQLYHPNSLAINLAKIDMWSTGRPFKVSIGHRADGLGMDQAQFISIRKTLCAKFQSFMNTDEDFSYNASVAFLSKAFSVEVPRHTEKLVVKRLFSLAARWYLSSLNDEVKHHLQIVGARVPEDNGISQSCFGIQYDSSNSKCESCGRNSSCSVETVSLGLDQIVPSPSILGPKTQRCPSIQVVSEDGLLKVDTLPGVPVEASTAIPNEAVEDLTVFLREHFKSATIKPKSKNVEQQEAFSLRTGEKNSPILWLKKCGNQRRLLFTKPSAEVSTKLEKDRGFYLKENTPIEEAKALIAKHADEKSRANV